MTSKLHAVINGNLLGTLWLNIANRIYSVSSSGKNALLN